MVGERRDWTRDETIVAFNLYCKIPFNKVTKRNPTLVKYADIIGRTPSALVMKIANLGRFDLDLQKRGISGLTNGSKLDEDIWNEFNGDWGRLAFTSEQVIARLAGNKIEDREAGVLPEGIDIQLTTKTRINQAFFRSTILSAYDNRCCITGLSVPQLLVASHIIPWALRTDTRTNPHNGLLLNSIHDKAFDVGLITVTTDYKVKVSSQIYDLLPDATIDEWFINYDGKQISLPYKFLPSIEYLQWHNDNIFHC